MSDDNAELRAAEQCYRACMGVDNDNPTPAELRAPYFLADAYLSLLDAQRKQEEEDAKLTDNDWIASLGGKPTHWGSGTIDWDIPCDDFRLTIRVWSNGVRAHPDAILENRGDSGNFQIEVPTRGHVRKLCEALGIELQGEAK